MCFLEEKRRLALTPLESVSLLDHRQSEQIVLLVSRHTSHHVLQPIRKTGFSLLGVR